MFVTNKSTAAYRAQTARTAFVKAPTEETRDAYLAALMRAKLEGAFVNLEAAKRAADHILRNARGRKLP